MVQNRDSSQLHVILHSELVAIHYFTAVPRSHQANYESRCRIRSPNRL